MDDGRRVTNHGSAWSPGINTIAWSSWVFGREESRPCIGVQNVLEMFLGDYLVYNYWLRVSDQKVSRHSVIPQTTRFFPPSGDSLRSSGMHAFTICDMICPRYAHVTEIVQVWQTSTCYSIPGCSCSCRLEACFKLPAVVKQYQLAPDIMSPIIKRVLLRSTRPHMVSR